jgi:hypothetical protein
MKKRNRLRAQTEWLEIWFKVSKDERGYPRSVDWEGLWAEPVDDNFVIQSIPFYLNDVSKGDLVSAHETENATLEFESVLRRGGHSTFRILLADEHEGKLDEVLLELDRLGATSEVEIGSLVAIDAPPENQEGITNFIAEGCRKGYWDEDDGFISRS